MYRIRGSVLISLFLVCVITHLACASKPITPPTGEVPVSPEVEANYQKAESLYQAKDYRGAYRLLGKTVPLAKNPGQHEKVLFLMAESLFQRKSYEPAYKMYEQVITLYPKTERLNDIIAREYEIGFAFGRGAKRTLFGLHILPAAEYGMDIVRKTLQKYPYMPASEKCHLALAEHFFRSSQYEEARLECDTFMKTYSQSALLPRAYFMIGQCYLKEYQGPEYDIAPLLSAKEYFQGFIEKYPDDPLKGEAQNKLTMITNQEAERDYRIGWFYWKTGKTEAAHKYFQSVLTNYPNTEWAKKAHELLLPK